MYSLIGKRIVLFSDRLLTAGNKKTET